ncbi:Asp-tRNA(Asn)/Glu-tRNA(Gln) amidotransferase subunit GatC [Paracrocinitomix mangrovi]|uniref:Asp-tRNA(Asn)/Glu-tRNA(Gln) amidotransferase subunit GatC n=1 Tax=Paracrocinitomix mangrovi TaxID=2862509 RepID=UPI001C8DBB83|nr:Asp-tRNA(Asn)/Glu-tRNA(Gln) amidotransferase subunit GatC [Paracrocinitomix mangrovi]UKN00295.1 Asp-tRNA(Asn)/Glu-tRNA(Gln) amidotransferase subunit GatC [Paracrocinitomix mangrovi]
MEIKDELVDHIAHLARLEFEGEKKEAIKADLIKMIDFVDQLNQVDTEGVEPLIFMTDSINVLREDVAKVTITQEEALKNAPNKDSDYFKIAKVLSK